MSVLCDSDREAGEFSDRDGQRDLSYGFGGRGNNQHNRGGSWEQGQAQSVSSTFFFQFVCVWHINE